MAAAPIVLTMTVQNAQAIPQAMQQAAGAVQSGSAQIKTATTGITASFQQAAQAGTVFQGNAQQVAAALATVAQAASTIPPALAPIVPALNQIPPPAQKAAYSIGEARIAAMGLGQEFGVHMPRALTRFLAQSSTIGPILASAFSGVAAIALISVVSQLTDKIKEGMDAMMGFDEAAKKAYESTIAGSRAAIAENAKLAKQMRDIQSIGITGVPKALASVKDQAAEQKDLSVRAKEAQETLAKLNAELSSSAPKVLESGGDVLTGVLNAVVSKLDPTKRSAEEIRKDIEYWTAESDKIRVEQKDTSGPGKARAAKEMIDAQRADALKLSETKKAYSDAQFADEMQQIKQQRAEGLLTLSEESEKYDEILRRKLQADKTYADERKKLSAPGAITGSQLEVEQQTIAQKNLTERQANAAQAAAQSRKNDEEEARARIDTEFKASEQEIRADEASIRQRAELHKLSSEQERSALLADADRLIEAERKKYQSLLALQVKYSADNRAQAVTLQAELDGLNAAGSATRSAIEADIDRRDLEDKKKSMEETIRVTEELAKRQMEITVAADNTRLATGQETLHQWQAHELAAIETWYQTQHIVLLKQVEDARAAFGEESELYKRMVDKMRVLDQQRRLDVQKVNDEVLKSYKKTYDQITSQINNQLVQVLTMHKTLAQGIRAVEDQMLNDLASFLLKQIEKWLFYHVVIKAINAVTGGGGGSGGGQQQAQKQAAAQSAIQTDAAQASADVFLQAIEGIPFPANLAAAPALAAAVNAQMQAFSAQAAAAGAVGTHYAQGGIVPTDGPAFLHRKEMVLPAPISQTIQNLAQNGGGRSGGDIHAHTHFHGPVGGDPADIANATNKMSARSIKKMIRNGQVRVRI